MTLRREVPEPPVKKRAGQILCSSSRYLQELLQLAVSSSLTAGNEDAPTHAQDISALWLQEKKKILMRIRGGRD